MSTFLKDFRAFAMKGNVMDMAVGVIIGGAFGKIVTSLVGDILMPLISIISGNVDLSQIGITVGNSVIAYGKFLQSVIDFVIIALCIFVMIRWIGKMRRKPEPVEADAPPPEDIRLLTEIRDLLKK